MKKVLIVEQDIYTAEAFADSLSCFNYNPVIFYPGQALAIELIETNPHIVIIHRSIFLKNKQLFVSSMNTKERLSDSCIILTSNTLYDPDEVRELGADYLLVKPFDLDLFLEILQLKDTKTSSEG